MEKTLFLIYLIFILSACSSDNDDSEPSTPEVVKSLADGKLVLGPVKGATIKVYPFQNDYESFVLDETNSGDDSSFTVDVDNINKNLKKFSLSPDFLLLVAAGGIDTDPNDDGIIIESEFIEVKGKVYGLVDASNLTSDVDFNINLISSFIVDYFLKQDEVNEKDVDFFLRNSGILDKDNNGILNLNDVIAYDMQEDHSTAESVLRKFYLEYIHSGENELRQLAISDITEMRNTHYVRIKQQSQDEMEINIYPSVSENKLVYYYASDPTFILEGDIDESIFLSIKLEEGVYYKECDEDNICTGKNLLYYDGSRLHKGAVPASSFSIAYSDMQNMKALRVAFIDSINTYHDYEKLKPEWESELETVKKEHQENLDEINLHQNELDNIGNGY